MTVMLKEISKFAGVGAVATLVDYALLNLLLVVNAPLWLATLVGFSAGAIVGYFLNNIWTYKNLGKKNNWQDLTKYVVVAAFGLLWTELIMHYLVNDRSMSANLSKLVAVFIVFFWNFLINRIWTFKGSDNA